MGECLQAGLSIYKHLVDTISEWDTSLDWKCPRGFKLLLVAIMEESSQVKSEVQ